MAGMVAAYELMKLGLKPVVYEASKMGGRLRSQAFEGSEGVIAELGGMRFPVSSTAFYHYVDKLGLETKPFPNPLTPASGSTVIDLEGQTFYAQKLDGSACPVSGSGRRLGRCAGGRFALWRYSASHP
jgi:Flavin containing amine oxidoreductase.